MHVSEGVLSAPVLAGGAAAAALGLGWSLRGLPWSRLMEVGLLSAAFFVASLVHIPVGPSSVHLIMNGLLGAILGWSALPALAVAIFLQALLFQFGGLSTLGVNICIMALPAVLCGRCFRPLLLREKTRLPAPFSAVSCPWPAADFCSPCSWPCPETFFSPLRARCCWSTSPS